MVRWGALGLAIVGIGAVVARPAEACEPPTPEIQWHSPEDGESLPANAALLIHGVALTIDALVVEVDGQPAALVDAHALSGDYGTYQQPAFTQAFFVDPEPAAGATVTVRGEGCFGGCELDFSFVTTEPDLAPPPAPVSVEFDVLDLVDADVMYELCGGFYGPSLLYFVDVEPADLSDESYFVYTLEGVRADGSVAMTTHFQTTSPVVSRGLAEDETFTSPDDVCLRVGMLDRSGNASDEAVEACLPCFYRDVSGPVELAEVPVEPAWRDEDVFDGGVCAVAGGSTGGDDGADDGTADGTDGGGSSEDGVLDDGGVPADGGDDTGGPGSGSGSGGEAVGLEGRGCGCSQGAGGSPLGSVAFLVLIAGMLRMRR